MPEMLQMGPTELSESLSELLPALMKVMPAKVSQDMAGPMMSVWMTLNVLPSMPRRNHRNKLASLH